MQQLQIDVWTTYRRPTLDIRRQTKLSPTPFYAKVMSAKICRRLLSTSTRRKRSHVRRV